MLTIGKTSLPFAALLCTAALGACAAEAGPALAGEAEVVTTGAAAAPSGEAESLTPKPATAPASPEGVALATWFGPGLFGRHTACGQLLTKRLLGVANRTLPCGTMVSFSYGGRQITVPVVDRGPYGSIGASWDLTLGAARLLKMGGTGKVDAKVVGHAKNSPGLGSPASLASRRRHRSKPALTSPSGGVQAG